MPKDTGYPIKPVVNVRAEVHPKYETPGTKNPIPMTNAPKKGVLNADNGVPFKSSTTNLPNTPVPQRGS